MDTSRIDKISEIIGTVDISVAMSGETVVELCKKNNVEPRELSKILGLEYLRDIVKEIIKDYTDCFFFEYSILSSVLDVRNKNYLISLACINDDTMEKVFKVNIENEVGNVLAKFTDVNEKNWFHNPELFIAPSKINITVSYSKDLDVDKKEQLDTKAKKVFGEYGNAISIGNFSYKRPFEKIINAAQTIKNKSNVEEAQLLGHKELHLLYDCNFFRKHNIQSNTCYISFPVLGAKSGQYPNAYKNIVENMQGQGVFFLYIQLKNDNKLVEFQQNIGKIKTDLFFQIGEMIRLFSYNYIFNNGLNLVEETRHKSIQSAISAIMSRNMSHNLGSHFITNTKNYIAKAAEGLNSADLRGIRHVLQYTQERMDYLATIVSGDQYPLGALNVKAQLFDELTIDDFAKRHSNAESPKITTNFFLKYLVYSEKYSHDAPEGFQEVEMRLKFLDFNAENDENRIFTGKVKVKDEETKLKSELSKLNIAVPGGIMARHAFFNIIENIIRNSAKHNSKSSNANELIVTIEIGKHKQKHGFYKISIYDNMQHANTKIEIPTKNGKKRLRIIDLIKSNFQEIEILDENGMLDKKSKGLKEMLISALWLQNKDIADTLSKIDRLKEKEKVDILNDCIEVEDINGNLAYSFNIRIFEPVQPLLLGDVTHTFTDNDGKERTYKLIEANDLLKLSTDVVCCAEKTLAIKNKDGNVNKKDLCEIIPRLYIKPNDCYEKNVAGKNFEKEMFIEASRNVVGEYSDYVIEILDNTNKGKDELENERLKVCFNPEDPKTEKKVIQFRNHFSNMSVSEKFNIYNKAPNTYIESISGGNFTKTITSPEYMNDAILRYKVAESALTKIAIIDERFFEKYKHNRKTQSYKECVINNLNAATSLENFYNRMSDNEETIDSSDKEKLNCYELEFSEKKDDISKHLLNVNSVGSSIEELDLKHKNIFIYNIDFDKERMKGAIKAISDDIIATIENDGSIIPMGKNTVEEKIHFLSIHLGLIEKYRQYVINNTPDSNLLKTSEIMDKIMEQIREKFGNVNFISVHSGRGNFSKELEDDLKDYPFISLSALEAAFDNSKYFLSQLFYNTIYYGKGNFNDDKGGK